MAVLASGPVFAGGFETVTVTEGGERYRLWYLPDINNDQLQQRGESPVYYWVPNAVSLARKGGTRDFKFHLLHFVGVLSDETTVGAQGDEEVAGGVLSLTTTAAPPLEALEQSHEQILDRFRGTDDHYWGWRSRAAPRFQPMPIASNRTALSNITPNRDGSVPGAGDLNGAGGAASPSPEGAEEGGGGTPTPRGLSADRFPRRTRRAQTPRTLPLDRAPRTTNLEAWYWQLHGEGAGSIDPAGENAFSGLLGSLPTAILWQGFHGAYSPVTVTNALSLKVWSPVVYLRIHGRWDRIFEHFSANARGRYLWFSADIQAEINNMRISGALEVDLQLDETVPSSGDMTAEINKRIDAITKLFMDQAKTRIFDPAPPQVTPAQAPGDGGGGLLGLFSPPSAGLALNYRRDRTTVDLHYEETRSIRYELPHVISSTLEGFYDEIRADPDAERKYFTTLYLDDWDRKVTRFVTPIANWREEGNPEYTGDPIETMSVQIGYPNTRGEIQWRPHIFTANDRSVWSPAVAQKRADDVVGAPEDWTPDRTFVKRAIHFKEPPSALESPYARYQILQQDVELDPGPNGWLTNNNDLVVRADSAGKIELTIDLNVPLENANQKVEVEFQALDADLNPLAPAERFAWNFADQEEPRYWVVFTGDPDYGPTFRYRVHVIVRGSIFTPGQEWYGPWVEGAGNGPFTVSVPTPDQAVDRRRLTARELIGSVPVGEGAGEGEGEEEGPVGPPPSTVVGPPPPSTGVGMPPPGERMSGAMEIGEKMVSGYELTEPKTAISPPPASSAREYSETGERTDYDEDEPEEGESVDVAESENYTEHEANAVDRLDDDGWTTTKPSNRNA